VAERRNPPELKALSRVQLGRTDISVSVLGLGCMGMSECYGPSDDAQNLATLERALELGINFLDTADSYGPFHNEELLGQFLVGRRSQFVVASKFGFVQASGSRTTLIDNSPEYIRKSCEGSLRRLRTDTIDLYYVHRYNPEYPIEETIGVLADLVREGKIRAIGLSEVSAETLRRAASVYPITALQSEYSLWARQAEIDVFSACDELGTSFVAFAPLGRGFLTHTIKSAANLAPDDYRRQQPRFNGPAAEVNAHLVNQLADIARANDCTPAQLALAWILSARPTVIPIPGVRRIGHLQDNVAAARTALNPALRASLDRIFHIGAAAGARYDEDGMRLVGK
jgi:aryl-alcohol dehydrogenase-like predicted oxidoreductase